MHMALVVIFEVLAVLVAAVLVRAMVVVAVLLFL